LPLGRPSTIDASERGEPGGRPAAYPELDSQEGIHPRALVRHGNAEGEGASLISSVYLHVVSVAAGRGAILRRAGAAARRRWVERNRTRS
jgi:hypothetical protein